MRTFLLALTTALLVGCGSHPASHKSSAPGTTDDGHGGHGPAHGAMLMVQTEPATVQAGQPVRLKLMLHDAKGAMIRAFDTVHDEKIHLIMVRDGLDHFAHIHPSIDPSGDISATHTFPAGGLYRLFVDFQPAGAKPTTAKATLQVMGAGAAAPALRPDAPGKVQGEGLAADISIADARAGAETKISFGLLDSAAKPVTDLQTYLGALGHLVILSADGSDYVHAHPGGKKAADGVVAFEAHFQKPGIYKGWGQFKRADKVQVVPFVLQIN